MDLKQDVQDFIIRAKENSSSEAKRQLEVLPSLYSEHHLEYPIDLTRISPFKCLKRGYKRKYVENTLYKNQFGFVRFSGIELGVDDEDVFMLLLKKGRKQLFAREKIVEVKFTKREFLKELGRYASGKNIKLLDASLDRIAKAHFHMESKRFISGGTLISHAKIDKETGKVIIRLNEEWGQFFIHQGGCTQVNYQQRIGLSRDITKKIHAHLQGQKNKRNNHQYTLKLSLVRSITHSITSDKDLKRKVKRALEQLRLIGFLIYFKPDENGDFFVVMYPKKASTFGHQGEHFRPLAPQKASTFGHQGEHFRPLAL